MDWLWWLSSLLALAIGVSLGRLGGGGSILTVPGLVYVVGQRPEAAMSTSLVGVGLNAVVGSLLRLRQGFAWFVILVALYMLTRPGLQLL